MQPKEILFESKAQIYKNTLSASMATIKLHGDGTLQISHADGTSILESSVRKLRFSNRGFGPDVGVELYTFKGFSLTKPVYEILFYDKLITNPSDQEYEEFKVKKKHFLQSLSDLGAYSGGKGQVIKMLIMAIIGITLFVLIGLYLQEQQIIHL